MLGMPRSLRPRLFSQVHRESVLAQVFREGMGDPTDVLGQSEVHEI